MDDCFSAQGIPSLSRILIDLGVLTINPAQFIGELKKLNIGTGVHFVTLHLHKYYRETFGFRMGDFPIAEYISARVISLLLSPHLPDEGVDDVVSADQRMIVHSPKIAIYPMTKVGCHAGA